MTDQPGDPTADDLRDALTDLLAGEQPGRDLDDIVADYIDRHGHTWPSALDDDSVWPLLRVLPGCDPTLVPIVGGDCAATVILCSCGSIADGGPRDGRVWCETCGNYYNADTLSPLPDPDLLRTV